MRFRPLQAVVPAALLMALPAFAESAECAADPRSSACTLGHTLHLLYWAAGVMAVVLTVVVLLAVVVYRKNKSTELKPND